MVKWGQSKLYLMGAKLVSRSLMTIMMIFRGERSTEIKCGNLCHMCFGYLYRDTAFFTCTKNNSYRACTLKNIDQSAIANVTCDDLIWLTFSIHKFNLRTNPI